MISFSFCGSGFFHTMENFSAVFPHNGKKFSTLWKNRPCFSTLWKKVFHTVENPGCPLETARRGVQAVEVCS